MKALSVALSTVLFLLAPGPQAVSVFAQTVTSAVPVRTVVAVPVAPIGGAQIGGGGPSVANGILVPVLLTPSVLPAGGLSITISPAALPVSAAVAAGGNSARTAIAERVLSITRISSVRPAAQGIGAAQAQSEPASAALKTSRGVLQTVAARLGKADAPAEKRSLLGELFAGSRRAYADDDVPVTGRESVARTALAPSGWKTAVAGAEPSSPAPAAPERSKFAVAMRWALPIIAMTALIVGLDFGTKFLAAKYLFTVFHECAWRAPVMKFIIPYILVTASIARNSLQRAHGIWRWSPKQVGNGRFGFYKEKVSGTDEMSAEHPWMRGAVIVYDVAIALMLGGLLGNGIDALRLGGALDWIPLGRSLMNFADVALLSGLAFFQLATDFFIKAGKAHAQGKPLHFSTVTFLGLPLLGFFISWAFGTAPNEDVLMLALKNIGFVYLMGFSMLLGISRLLAAFIVDRFAKKYAADPPRPSAPAARPS